jgi:release factor glutamine methyltransferase
VATVAEELSSAAGELAQSGAQTPRLDAELLLAHVLGTDRAGLVIAARDQLSGDARTRYLALLVRRLRHEPIAYILGRKGFRNIELAVDPRVLIPRPETELLVEVGLTLPTGARVIDVGAGSGAVALALKQERPDLDVTGAELSAGALSVARMNASRLRLDVEFLQSDLLEQVGAGFDAVLANLPYVASAESLPPDVALYEPAGALFSGFDGLDLVRRLVEAAGGRDEVRLLALEIGFDQADTVAALVAAAGFDQVERVPDLAGHQRIVVGRR